MDWLNNHTGVLFCSVECAHGHHQGGPQDELVEITAEDYNYLWYGCFCPVCLQPYESWLLTPAGQASTDSTDRDLHLEE